MFICNLLKYTPAASLLVPLLCGSVPPGVPQWETLASPTPNTCIGSYLFSAGWRGQPGVKCATLEKENPTMTLISYLLDDLCELTLFGEQDCEEGTVVREFNQTTEEHARCVEVPEGFRSLSIQCEYDVQQHP